MDLCGLKSKNKPGSLENIETSTLSVKAIKEFNEADLKKIYTDKCDIRIPANGTKIGYVKFEDVETAKLYKAKNLKVKGRGLIFYDFKIFG